MNNRLPWISPWAAWLLLAPVPLFVLGSFVAFIALAVGQQLQGGEALWGFGSFYGADPILDVIWWTLLAITSVGLLNLLSRYNDARHAAA
ncbi:MAG: hypothetical protein NUV56_04530 [Candidatus Uhrbacteria bacterium]|nr:hypothetical protein [Candidatus Uhrbacteria bacterium]